MFEGLFSSGAGAAASNAGSTAGAGASSSGSSMFQNPMALASFLGMVGGALGGPNTWQGRLGMGVSQMANTQMMAMAQLEREKGQRDFLSKLLAAHNKIDKNFSDQTPTETGGGMSKYFDTTAI